MRFKEVDYQRRGLQLHCGLTFYLRCLNGRTVDACFKGPCFAAASDIPLEKVEDSTVMLRRQIGHNYKNFQYGCPITWSEYGGLTVCWKEAYVSVDATEADLARIVEFIEDFLEEVREHKNAVTA